MDRSTCHYYGPEIDWIRLVSGKLAPVDPRAEKVDGKNLLIFPNGVTAGEHLEFQSRYTNHHVTYSRRETDCLTRQESARRDTESLFPHLQAFYKDWVIL